MPMFEDSSALRFDRNRFTDVAGDYNHWDASYRPYNSHNGNYNIGANSGTSTGNVISMRTSRPRENTPESVAKNRGGIPLGDAPPQPPPFKSQRNGERNSNTTNSLNGYNGRRDDAREGPVLESTATTAAFQASTRGDAPVTPLDRLQLKAKVQQNSTFTRSQTTNLSRFKSNNPFRKILLDPSHHAPASPQTPDCGDYPWSRRERPY